MGKQELNDIEIMQAGYYVKMASFLKKIENCEDLKELKNIFLEIIEILDKMIELEKEIEDVKD